MMAMTQAEMARLLSSGAVAARAPATDGKARLAEAIKLPGGRRPSSAKVRDR